MAVEPRPPSRTAVMTAAARALHRQGPPPHILDDALALPLAGVEGRALVERLRADLPGEGWLSFSRWVCVRARLPEDLIEEAMRTGFRQYVILGAGLDSFALRRPDLVGRLRVFEVDHPATKAWKRARLAELGLDPPENLVFAPVDFERQTLRAGLTAAGFDFAAPAIFSWVGVTLYLTLDAIRATLTTVAAFAAGSRIALTYNLPPAALRGMGLAVETTLGSIIAELGEPVVSRFEPAEIERLLRELRFENVVHVGTEEAVRTYFPGGSDVRFGGAQRLVVATVPAAAGPDRQPSRTPG